MIKSRIIGLTNGSNDLPIGLMKSPTTLSPRMNDTVVLWDAAEFLIPMLPLFDCHEQKKRNLIFNGTDSGRHPPGERRLRCRPRVVLEINDFSS